MIRALHIGENSVFLGQTCALCKQAFDSGDEIVICPEDGSRHHLRCWRANNNRCTAYGCPGQGEAFVGIVSRPQPERLRGRPQVIEQESAPEPISQPPRSKVRVMPSSNFGCARSCLLLFFLLVIVFGGLACFGLYYVVELVRETAAGPYPSLLINSIAALFL